MLSEELKVYPTKFSPTLPSRKALNVKTVVFKKSQLHERTASLYFKSNLFLLH